MGLRQKVRLEDGPRDGISMTEASWRYEMFFEYLQISPSYLLAHKIAVGEIDRTMTPLPNDFEIVEKTYRDFGPVLFKDFDDWWAETAKYQFGLAPDVEAESLAVLQNDEQLGDKFIEGAEIAVARYLNEVRAHMHRPALLIVAMPVYGDRNAVISAFSDLLAAHFGQASFQPRVAPYQPLANKVPRTNARLALQVLQLWAGTRAPLHRIGTRMKLSPAYATKLGKPEGDEREKRREMVKVVRGYVDDAYTFAENAARGRFPSRTSLPVDKNRPRFDRDESYQLIHRQLRWEHECERERSRQKWPDRKPVIGRFHTIFRDPEHEIGPAPKVTKRRK